MTISYRAALEALESRGFGIRPDRSRIEALVELLDHPERSHPAVHLAGTNGKSSTARMIGAVLAAHGLKTGVYTSPHLQSVRERFLIAGPGEEGEVLDELMTPDELAATVDYLLPFVRLVEARLGETVTYFELTTAMAFEWMASKSTSVGVFETGMGGTWDATNVVEAQVGVLTRVAVDHAEFLGDTPLDNAREKVGILKPGIRIVSSEQDPDVMALVESTAEERGVTVLVMGRDIRLASDSAAVSGRMVGVEGAFGSYGDLFVPLHGAHQSANAALAVAACEQLLGRALDPGAVRLGLAAVRSPGRMEVVRRKPLVVLDGAHNPDGAGHLAPAVAETFGERRRIFVISVFRDKDVDGIMRSLLPWCHMAILARSSSPRAEDPQRLVALARTRGIPYRTVESVGEGVRAALDLAAPDDVVVVCGSLYAVGEARDILVGPVE